MFLTGFVVISKFALYHKNVPLTGCLGEAQQAPKISLGQLLFHEGNKYIMESLNPIVLDHVLNPDHDTLDHPTAFSGSAGNIFCVQCAADR